MVAGIIVAAVGVELTITNPTGRSGDPGPGRSGPAGPPDLPGARPSRGGQ
jgi:hypothetical protein